MMRNIILVSVCVVLLVGMPSWAVPVKTASEAIQEANPQDETSGDYDMDWSFVYNYKGSSGVAIDAYWILTAEHVADDGGTGNLSIGGETYTAMETISHNTKDIALVRYDKVLPGHYNYATDPDFTGSEAIMIGYGNYGVVTQTPTSGWWSEPEEENPDVLRWGTNMVDALLPISSSYGTYDMLQTSISGTDTEQGQNPTPYETGVNTGDSGGGMFAEVGGEWILIGINTLRSPSSSPYDTTYSVPVGDYDEWIAANVPEPVTVWLLATLGAVGMLSRRRVR